MKRAANHQKEISIQGDDPRLIKSIQQQVAELFFPFLTQFKTSYFSAIIKIRARYQMKEEEKQFYTVMIFSRLSEVFNTSYIFRCFVLRC